MRIDRLPTQHPDVTVEPKGELYKIVRKVGAHETVGGLPTMLEDGRIESYAQSGDEVVVYAHARDTANQLAALPRLKRPSVIIEKAKEILLPPDMDKNVAPEYLKFRAWTLGASVAAGAVSFANIAVSLNALKMSFSTTEKAALAQTINTFAWRFSYMGGSFLAPRGEQDPRRFYLASNLISTANALATLSILSVLPTAFEPVGIPTSILGAVGSTLGSAAGVNVFNHMAINNKGVVQAKNSNQDLVASMLGMPLALGLKHVAHQIGMKSALLTAATMAPIMLFCSMKAASSVRMEPISRTELEKLCDQYIESGEIAAAPTHGTMETLASLFHSEKPHFSPNIEVCDKLESVVDGQDAHKLFSVYKDDKYLLSYDAQSGKSRIGLRKDASMDDIFKAYTQARLLEQAAPSLYPEVVKLKGDQAPAAFAELAHRALSEPNGATQKLIKQGWHANHLKLAFPTLDSQWTGQDPPALPAVTVADLKQLIANPDPTKLAQLLGDGGVVGRPHQ